ncbi:hypothetical protein ACXDF8_13920 [Mycolicibacterium sp. CBM1]
MSFAVVVTAAATGVGVVIVVSVAAARVTVEDFFLEVAAVVVAVVPTVVAALAEAELGVDDGVRLPFFVDVECPVARDGPLAEELLDADGPLAVPVPVVSADAAGIEASAAPMPNATADAPSQVNACEL